MIASRSFERARVKAGSRVAERHNLIPCDQLLLRKVEQFLLPSAVNVWKACSKAAKNHSFDSQHAWLIE